MSDSKKTFVCPICNKSYPDLAIVTLPYLYTDSGNYQICKDCFKEKFFPNVLKLKFLLDK